LGIQGVTSNLFVDALFLWRKILMASGMSFGDAILEMKKGRNVWRKGWNGKGIFIAIHQVEFDEFMTSNYIYIDTTSLCTDNPDAPQVRVPWLASQTDMLADDWMGVSP
jgi:hypothetical protein